MATSPEEIAVLEVNSAFYAAFAARDLGALEALWARRAPVTCIHPGWNALRGREEVMSSWRAILGGGSPPAIRCSAAAASVAGPVAWVICLEHVPGAIPLVATNLFVREDGAWRMCHHQAGPVQEPTREPPPGAMA